MLGQHVVQHLVLLQLLSVFALRAAGFDVFYHNESYCMYTHMIHGRCDVACISLISLFQHEAGIFVV